jgi:uncharacterized membrane protein YfcA
VAAGGVNAMVGSGSLITFPTLLAAGYGPVVANVSNTLGLVPGSISGAVGYRRELAGQGARLRHLGTASVSGGITGAVLLLTLPGSVFERVVPVLILVACFLMAVQPRLRRRVGSAGRGGRRLWLGVYATGIYGGYFGAAQGVILMALLSIFYVDDLQRLNGLKNVLAALVNGIAALLFIVFGDIHFGISAILAVGSIIGGQFGAHYGRRVPDATLRVVVIVVGLVVAGKLILAP